MQTNECSVVRLGCVDCARTKREQAHESACPEDTMLGQTCDTSGFPPAAPAQAS